MKIARLGYAGSRGRPPVRQPRQNGIAGGGLACQDARNGHIFAPVPSSQSLAAPGLAACGGA